MGRKVVRYYFSFGSPFAVFRACCGEGREDPRHPSPDSALEPDWRAGAMCVVASEGTVDCGDAVALEAACGGARRSV
jgi:hypothetical protein